MSRRLEWISDQLTQEERAELESLLNGEVVVGAAVIASRILRRVQRVALATGRVVYAKQHLFPFQRVRTRYALRRDPADKERRGLEEAARRGLSVPRVLALRSERSALGPRLAVLVTEEIPPARDATIDEAVRAVDRLVDARVFHPDLHGENLRIVQGESWFLDFQSVRFDRCGRRERMAMLAKFAEGLPRAEDGRVRDRDLLLEVFDTQQERDTFDWMLSELDAGARASRRRHRLRSSTLVVRERCGACGVRLRDRSIDPALLDPENFGPETTIEDPLCGRVRLAESADGELVRLRRSGKRLFEVWADADQDRGFLAWERTVPWPWATQALYIHASRRRDVSRSWEGQQ